MKVWVQEWVVPGEGSLVSLSKDQAQIDATYAAIFAKDEGVRREGDPEEITIPDDSPYAQMVQNGTVFLYDDERDVIYNSPEYREE